MNVESIYRLLKGSDEDVVIAHHLIYANPDFLGNMKPYLGGKTRQFIYHTKLNNIINQRPDWRNYFNSYVLRSVANYERDNIYTEFEDTLIISYRGNLYVVKSKK